MEMMTERDPARLVQLFFAAACDLVDSKYAAIALVDVGKQHGPAEATIQDYQERRQDGRGSIAQQAQAETMQHSDQCDADNPVFDEK